MTLFRNIQNGLLYTITVDRIGLGSVHKAHPYRHNIEIGVSFKGKRFRDFKATMTMKDFVSVAIC